MRLRLAIVLLTAALAAADEPPKRPGLFEWQKDLDTALAQSEKDGRPVILYFTFET